MITKVKTTIEVQPVWEIKAVAMVCQRCGNSSEYFDTPAAAFYTLERRGWDFSTGKPVCPLCALITKAKGEA